MADNHSAFSCAQGPAGPIHRAWPYGGVAQHGPEGGGDQLPIWPMAIVASARPSYLRRVTGVYIISRYLRRVCIISMMDDTKPPRSSLSSRKEGTASPHWASGLWNGSPRYLGGFGQPPTRFLPKFPVATAGNVVY